MKKVLYLLIFSILQTSCLYFKESSLIEGKWIVKESEVEIFDLPNNCKGISNSDIFNFEKNYLTIKLDENNSCGKYYYEKLDNILEIQISDISFKLKIITIDKDKLILSSTFLPKQMMINWKEEYVNYKKDGFKIILQRVK